MKNKYGIKNKKFGYGKEFEFNGSEYISMGIWEEEGKKVLYGIEITDVGNRFELKNDEIVRELDMDE